MSGSGCCKVASAAATGLSILSTLAGAMIGSVRGEGVLDGATKGYMASKNEKWVKGVKYICK